MKPSRQQNQLSAFAVTAPGLETICARELAELGIRGRVSEGGVAWSGSMETIARANLWLRTANRVIVRVAEFRAKAFHELELSAKRIEWERWVAPKSAVEFRVTCRKSKLYHSGAVAQRFTESVERRVAGVRAAVGHESDEEAEGVAEHPQLFIVRFVHDVCTVSVDTSGPLLHLRGYRQAVAKAPLRETLAAAILLGAQWTGETPLIDPMCGSGTIPIEAARLARRIAPGRDRSFALQRWPDADEQLWKTLLAEARANERPTSPVVIEGSDRDEGAIAAAKSNAERAGVADDISFAVRPISALSAAEAPGLVASNPPYGVRIGDSDRLRNLYAQLGNVAREKRPGWTLALLSADRKLERQLHLDLYERFRTRNGGIPVRLVTAAIQPAAIPTRLRAPSR
ncbi:MAG TPA: class I SAM-dependent RNA methyltransferase [Gemmatimonadaceae bacterium]